MGSYARLWRARARMMRPRNGAMAALAALAGILVTDPHGLPAASWIGAPLAAFLVASFGNVWNDVQDRDLDRRAHPDRPLPAGEIRVQDAQAFAVLLLAFGLWQAFVAGGLATLAFAAANAAALLLYEYALKARGLAGNALVAALVASAFAFGAAAAGAAPASWGVLWLLMAMAFLANLARELLKDLEDARADRGRRSTFPLAFGAAPTRLLAFLLVQAAVLASLWAFRHPPEGWWRGWLWLLAAADAAFVAAASLAWQRLGAAQRLLKAAMALALVAFLAGAGAPLAVAGGAEQLLRWLTRGAAA